MLPLLAFTCASASPPGMISRRVLMNVAALHPLPATAAQVVAPGFEPSRVEGIGGGADMLSEASPAVADVLYPPSMNGTWQVRRIVTSVEGDTFQAEGAWRLLGGYGSDLRAPEQYTLLSLIHI